MAPATRRNVPTSSTSGGRNDDARSAWELAPRTTSWSAEQGARADGWLASARRRRSPPALGRHRA
jgi:hypothetical protein